MRTFFLSMLLVFTCCIQTALATPADTFSVQGPDLAHRLTFQEIDEGKLLVSVTDKAEKPLMGLTKADFNILKGPRTAQVVDVQPLATSKEVGLNIVLVVDNSASMKNRKAVQPLLEALEAFYQIVRPIDNISIVVYDDRQTVRIDDQQLHAKVYQSNDVDSLRTLVNERMNRDLTSGTYLYDAMMLGLDVIRKQPDKNNKFMVVFSDGEDLNSTIEGETVINAARNIPNFNAYMVDYMPTDSLDAFLQSFARQYNGHIWKANSAEDIVPIFQKFSSTLIHRYIVSYRWLNAPTGGIEFDSKEITIEEISTIDSSPLLNYIFFETGQNELPGRYIQLKDQAATNAFSETALTSVMDKYANVLNIIGSRMRTYPDATVTLVGCNSDTGKERGRQDLSRSRAESVRAYLRYVWGIAPDRLVVESHNLPQAPSTNRIPEGQAENQRVEIRSDHAAMLDTVKSEYVEKNCDLQQIKIIPRINAEAGIQDWKIKITCGDTAIGELSGSGEMAPACVFPMDNNHIDKMAAVGKIEARLQVTDKDGQEMVLEKAATLPVRFIKRQELMAQKQGYKVREKYALILFDYDSAAIKARNKIIMDRIISRIDAVPQASVDIVGHTDNIGKEDYNIALSQRRAEAVKEQFSQAQLTTAPAHLAVHGQGPHNSLYTNESPEGRSLNRTVTIALEYETH